MDASEDAGKTCVILRGFNPVLFFTPVTLARELFPQQLRCADNRAEARAIGRV
jgi:hypothetical protein